VVNGSIDRLHKLQLQHPQLGDVRVRGAESALRRPSATADEIGERGHGCVFRRIQSTAEIVPERDPQLSTGLGQAEEGIATIAPDIAAGAPADAALRYLSADVTLGPIGVQRDLGAIEHSQQFGLVGTQPRQQAIKRDEPSAAIEDAIEAGAQLTTTTRRRGGAIRFEISAKPPNQRSDTLLDDALPLGEGVELMDQPFCVDPTQSVTTDVELAGVVADNHRIAQELVRVNAAP